jgi:hypothetical protein
VSSRQQESNNNTINNTITTHGDESKPSISNKQQKVEDANPVFFDSVRKNIAKLTLTELQRALQVRGVTSSGQKLELQQRLFESLMTDAGLAPS